MKSVDEKSCEVGENEIHVTAVGPALITCRYIHFWTSCLLNSNLVGSGSILYIEITKASIRSLKFAGSTSSVSLLEAKGDIDVQAGLRDRKNVFLQQND